MSVEQTLEGLFQELGPVPGLYYDSFQGYLNPRMAKILKEESIPALDSQFSMQNCSLDIKCRDFLSIALNFVKRVDLIFQRPFPKLGTWISLFAKKVFSGCQFHYHFTLNFYEGRSPKRKKYSQAVRLFALMGSAHVKAVLKMLVKSATGQDMTSL